MRCTAWADPENGFDVLSWLSERFSLFCFHNSLNRICKVEYHESEKIENLRTDYGQFLHGFDGWCHVCTCLNQHFWIFSSGTCENTWRSTILNSYTCSGVCNPVQKSCILTACSILVEWYSCFVQDFKPSQPVFTKSLTGSLLTFFGTPPSAHAMWRPHPRCFRGNHITVNKTCYFTLLYGVRRVFEPLFFFSDEY